MKVLFIGPLPEPVTGQSLACQVFLDALRLHHEVDVVDINKKALKAGVSSLGRVREVLSFVWQVWRRHGDADVIYFTTSESVAGNLKDLLIYLVCLPRLSRMVIHLHGGAGMRFLMSSRHPVLWRMNNFFLARLGGVIVLGARHVPIFSGTVKRDRIHIVANFASDDLFRGADEIGAKHAQGGGLRLLFLSNLLPGKGHVELAAAVAELTAAGQGDFALDMAGSFESDEERDAFLEGVKALPQIRYHGPVRGAQKQALFASAHIFCLPTYYPYEGQPISILEAYASGCAVMTTDHSGIFDTFTPGLNGYAVEKGSPSSIAEAIRSALADPGQIARFAIQNRDAAERLYRVETYNRNLLGIIQSVGSAAA